MSIYNPSQTSQNKNRFLDIYLENGLRIQVSEEYIKDGVEHHVTVFCSVFNSDETIITDISEQNLPMFIDAESFRKAIDMIFDALNILDEKSRFMLITKLLAKIGIHVNPDKIALIIYREFAVIQNVA